MRVAAWLWSRPRTRGEAIAGAVVAAVGSTLVLWMLSGSLLYSSAYGAVALPIVAALGLHDARLRRREG